MLQLIVGCGQPRLNPDDFLLPIGLQIRQSFQFLLEGFHGVLLLETTRWAS